MFTDEIYEHIHYLGPGGHVPAGDGARARGPHGHHQRPVEDLRRHRLAGRLDDRARRATTAAIRKVHDFLTVGAAAPLQEAGVAAMALPPTRTTSSSPTAYRERRDVLCDALDEGGLRRARARRRLLRDVRHRRRRPRPRRRGLRPPARHDVGVAAVPGSSFYADPTDGAGQIRFAFPKRIETLLAAAERLAAVARD